MSACISPSIFSQGASTRASSVARRALRARTCRADPKFEKDSIACAQADVVIGAECRFENLASVKNLGRVLRVELQVE